MSDVQHIANVVLFSIILGVYFYALYLRGVIRELENTLRSVDKFHGDRIRLLGEALGYRYTEYAKPSWVRQIAKRKENK